MLFCPLSWLTLKLLVTNALMRMQWLSLGRAQGSPISTVQSSIAFFSQHMKCGQVVLVISSQLHHRAFLCQADQALAWFSDPGSKRLHLWIGFKAWEHSDLSMGSAALQTHSCIRRVFLQNMSFLPAFFCCRTDGLWLLVDVNGKGSSLWGILEKNLQKCSCVLRLVSGSLILEVWFKTFLWCTS